MSDYYTALMGSLNEAIQFAEGDQKKGTVRTLKFKPLPQFTNQEVKSIREATHLSGAAFARVIGVSVKTVESWESGKSIPNGPSQRFLEQLKNDPKMVEEYILS